MGYIEKQIVKLIHWWFSGKPCSICDNELQDGYALETEPFRISITRYCDECMVMRGKDG